jgi:hypothetical protein
MSMGSQFEMLMTIVMSCLFVCVWKKKWNDDLQVCMNANLHGNKIGVSSHVNLKWIWNASLCKSDRIMKSLQDDVYLNISRSNGLFFMRSRKGLKLVISFDKWKCYHSLLSLYSLWLFQNVRITWFTGMAIIIYM